MEMMTKEEYEKWIENTLNEKADIQPMWSEPMYICPKCNDGGMRKNLHTCVALASNPPITQYEYRCNKCDNVEYLRG